MTLTTDDLIAALRLRYDFYSAQTMLESALTAAGLAQKTAYDAAEVATFRAALSRVGDRLAAVDARLDALVPAPAPAPAVVELRVVKTKTVETVITLTGVPIDEDDRVLVCGGLPELGDWDVTRAQPMVREGDRWLAKLALAAGTEAAFKFVRCAADGSATWEAGANRSLEAVPSIETSWQ